MENPAQDLLTEFEVTLPPASKGKRFLNYIIDLLFFIIGSVAIVVLTMPDSVNVSDSTSPSPGDQFITRIGFQLLYCLFMFLLEAIFRGKSLGKLLTGTRAVNEDGSRITFKTALLRGLSRGVPFEPFSALGSPSTPWHDRWTHTLVIDEKQSRTVKEN